MIKKVRDMLRRTPMGTVTVSAVVVRADGTREDQGVIARGKMRLEAKQGAN